MTQLVYRLELDQCLAAKQVACEALTSPKAQSLDARLSKKMPLTG